MAEYKDSSKTVWSGGRTQSNFSPLQLPFTIGHADMGGTTGREADRGRESRLLLDPCLQLVGRGYREREGHADTAWITITLTKNFSGSFSTNGFCFARVGGFLDGH